VEGVSVSSGVFTVELDFGAAFGSTALYLQIGVSPGDSQAEYTPLSPRQKLTAAPYALYAPTAGTAVMAAPGNETRSERLVR
jgi:hypothetical protein